MIYVAHRFLQRQCLWIQTESTKERLLILGGLETVPQLKFEKSVEEKLEGLFSEIFDIVAHKLETDLLSDNEGTNQEIKFMTGY